MKCKQLISSVITMVLIVITMLSSIPTQVKAAQKPVYVALGDSIAAGYGLSGYESKKNAVAPKSSYQSIVAKKLGADVINDAVSGMTSAQLLDLLQSGILDQDLENADYVSVSIGSNDVLLPFMEMIAQSVGSTDSTEDAILEKVNEMRSSGDLYQAIEKLNEIKAMMVNNETLNKAAHDFSAQFSDIMAEIKEKAPSANIYVTNVYNPYNFSEISFLPLGTYAKPYIVELNQAFQSDSKEYTLIDVYSAFQKGNYVNANATSDLNSMSLDPHPNVAGHKEIARLIYASMRDEVRPDKTTIKSITSTKKNVIKLSLKKVNDCDGIEIRYSTKADGTYSVLCTVEKTNATIISKKLKAGKKYYVRAYAYNKLGSSMIYSKKSAMKMVVIAK